MKHLLIFLLALLLSSTISAQDFKMDLYPQGKIPNRINSTLKEIIDSTDIVRISKVQVPDIAVYLPSKRNSRKEAIIICPGGGYRILAYDWEGKDIARFWNSRGIAAIVLKYRLPDPESQTEAHKVPLMDAQRAMRMVRYHAKEWNINPDKIGIMGFSAGGHLASTLSTHYDSGNPSAEDPVERMSCRPDYSILVYPVISFTADFAHPGSGRSLLGENPSLELKEQFSNEKQVTADTPPAILIHAADDKVVPVANSLVYFEALQEYGIYSALHVYPTGGHGFSLAVGKPQLSGWIERCFEWLMDL